jgi:DNA-binding MarR family transcriptional regulator
LLDLVSYANYNSEIVSTGKSERQRELADRLHSLAIHLLRRLRIQDLASGVGPAKLSALSVLVFSAKPLSLAELAAAEQVKNPTMSRLVTEMERDGLVRTRPSQHDARSIQISPTARGKELLLAGRKRRVDSLTQAMSDLGPAELDKLHHCVEVLQLVVRKI